MKKLLMFLLLNFLFLGCAKKNSFYIDTYDPTIDGRIELLNDSLNDKFYYAKAISYSKFGGISEEELIEFILKKISKKTLESEKKYFFIASPREVSNYDGRVINTIKGFQENINYVRSSNKFKCPNLKKYTCPNLEIEIIFVMLNEKSMDYVVWDAKKILDNI